MAATLQIVTINDVYEIDNLPSFATCIKECKADPKAHKTISTLPGDFVAPSILSSLDKGSSMIECLNMCELDYASIGNHESDIPLKQLHCRMRESKFTWINSNMPDLPLPEILPTPPASASVSATTTSTTTDTSVLLPIILPEYVVVEVVGDDGHTRRVALIGLCGEDRSVMKPGAFNDCFIEPVLDSGAKWYKHLMNVEKVDTVIPLTHQLIAYDRIMAQQKVGYPVIIGGHDHQPFNEEYDNCKILKVGMDGQRFGIINITWPNAQWPSDKPIVTIIEKEANTIARDPIVSETVTKCKKILLELEQSNLCRIPKDMILSSIGMRLKPTTIGTFICTTLKKALNCEICMCGSGSIRASKNYVGRSYFTYADLKAEMPFSTLIVVLNLPGQVCADMISHTRAYALQSPPVAKGGYIQTDDGVVWDRESNKVLQINGMPLQVDRIYRYVLLLLLLRHGIPPCFPQITLDVTTRNNIFAITLLLISISNVSPPP